MLGSLLSDSTYASFLNGFVKSFSQPTLQLLNENFLFPVRHWYLKRILTPYLRDSKNVLDLGSSDGRLTAQIQRKLAVQGKSIRFMGYDIHVQPKIYIPIIQYDGYHLPFAIIHSIVFSLLMCCITLITPLKVLQEAKRVSSQYVLI